MEPKDQKEQPVSLEVCLLIYDEECRLCISVKMTLNDEELVKQERVSDSSPIRAKLPELLLGNDIVLVDLRQLSSSNLPERSCRGLMHFPLFFPICLAGR